MAVTSSSLQFQNFGLRFRMPAHAMPQSVSNLAREWDNEKGWVETEAPLRTPSPAFSEPDEEPAASTSNSAAMAMDREPEVPMAAACVLEADAWAWMIVELLGKGFSRDAIGGHPLLSGLGDATTREATINNAIALIDARVAARETTAPQHRAELLRSLGLDHPPPEAELRRTKRRCSEWPQSNATAAFLVGTCDDDYSFVALDDDGCESMLVDLEQPRTPEDRLVTAFLDRPYLDTPSESRLFPRSRLDAVRGAAAERGAIMA